MVIYLLSRFPVYKYNFYHMTQILPWLVSFVNRTCLAPLDRACKLDVRASPGRSRSPSFSGAGGLLQALEGAKDDVSGGPPQRLRRRDSSTGGATTAAVPAAESTTF